MPEGSTIADPPAGSEFDFALTRGSELLSAGKVTEARDLFERAHEIAPKDSKASNLLGLTYFRLGQFDDAERVFKTLIEDNPTDATLRVNLGLVYLKAADSEEAIRELQMAIDLDKNHKKAHNYLGLALAKIGDYGKAREHFLQAGSDQMAAKMESAIHLQEGLTIEGDAPSEGAPQEDPLRPLSSLGQPPPEAQEQEFAPLETSPTPWPLSVDPRPVTPVPMTLREPKRSPSYSESNDGWRPPVFASLAAVGDSELSEATPLHDSPSEAFAPTLSIPAIEPSSTVEALKVTDAAASPGISSEAPYHPEKPSAPRHTSVSVKIGGDGASAVPGAPLVPLPRPSAVFTPLPSQRLRELGSVVWGHEPGGGLFQLGPEGLAVTVPGELFVRLDALVAVVGRLQATPAIQRRRGRQSTEVFSSGQDQLQRVSGNGLLYLEACGKRFHSVDLEDDSEAPSEESGVYLREEVIFAFEERIGYENGRLAAEAGPAIDMVHLSGAGRVLLQLSGSLKAMPLPVGVPMLVPMGRLVGWYGRVNPRLLAFGHSVAVELVGEGCALLGVRDED